MTLLLFFLYECGQKLFRDHIVSVAVKYKKLHIECDEANVSKRFIVCHVPMSYKNWCL